MCVHPRVVVLLAAVSGCAAAPEAAAPLEAASGACVVETTAEVVDLRATGLGLVLATATDAAVHIQRWHGSGCDLAASGPPVAAEALLDADDLGRVYVFPTEAPSPGAVWSMPPGESRPGMVATVDEDGVAAKLLDPGRGIWSFGVDPGGETLWVTACGPNGIFSLDDMTAAMAPPDTLWEQLPSALSDRRTFWSIGASTCPGAASLTAGCGYDLVRSTPEDSVAFGSTLADHGDGFMHAELARCGSGVCGVYPRAVRVWDGAGVEGPAITLADLGATGSERIAAASGGAAGVYVLLEGDGGSRVVFVPRLAAPASAASPT